jgi:hypothetical protein
MSSFGSGGFHPSARASSTSSFGSGGFHPSARASSTSSFGSGGFHPSAQASSTSSFGSGGFHPSARASATAFGAQSAFAPDRPSSSSSSPGQKFTFNARTPPLPVPAEYSLTEQSSSSSSDWRPYIPPQSTWQIPHGGVPLSSTSSRKQLSFIDQPRPDTFNFKPSSSSSGKFSFDTPSSSTASGKQLSFIDQTTPSSFNFKPPPSSSSKLAYIDDDWFGWGDNKSITYIYEDQIKNKDPVVITSQSGDRPQDHHWYPSPNGGYYKFKSSYDEKNYLFNRFGFQGRKRKSRCHKK